ncbi:MAG: ComF family protein [Rhodospirillaceae bacterium]
MDIEPEREPALSRAALLAAAKRLWDQGLDLALPPRCLGCGVRVDLDGVLCGDCFAAMTWISAPLCGCCGHPFDLEQEPDAQDNSLCQSCTRHPPLFDRVRSVLRYDDASASLVLGFKHADRTDAGPVFATWMTRIGRGLLEELAASGQGPKSDAPPVVLPVPLHPKRLAKRQYNQAALLSQAVAKNLGLEHLPLVLRRIKQTKGQGHLGRLARQEQVRGAFEVRAVERIAGRPVILVDDVFTTGATLEECALVLRKAGVPSISCLTLARVVFEDGD